MISGTTQSAFAQSASAMMSEWAGSRKKISLWLDLKIGREVEALEIIQKMKSRREFRRSVMLGLKMVWELRQGRVDTLLREFPDVVKWLQVKTVPPTPTDNSDLVNEIAALRKLILENGGLPPSPIAASGLKPFAAPTLAMPVFDDDDEPALTVTQAAAGDSGANFLRSLSGVVH